MTIAAWTILALAVIIVLIIMGILIWRKKSEVQVDSLHNIEKQLNEIGVGLKSDGLRTETAPNEKNGESGVFQAGMSDPDASARARLAAMDIMDLDPAFETVLPQEGDMEEEPELDEAAVKKVEPEIIDITEILGKRLEQAQQEVPPEEISPAQTEAVIQNEAGKTDETTPLQSTELHRSSGSIYNTGKSGKVYTEEELELLIKE